MCRVRTGVEVMRHCQADTGCVTSQVATTGPVPRERAKRDKEADQVFDTANGLTGSPKIAILDGRQSTFTIGFGVDNPSDIVMELSPGLSSRHPIVGPLWAKGAIDEITTASRSGPAPGPHPVRVLRRRHRWRRNDVAGANQPIDDAHDVTHGRPRRVHPCVNPGPEVTYGTYELSRVALPDGELTINRPRGYTWQSEVRDVSEPRLLGTWYNSVDSDVYTGPGGAPGPGFEAWTHRIENDAGAWQGSLVEIDFPDGQGVHETFMLNGEGDYEGLAAVGTVGFGAACPNIRGYIIDGRVPAPPVPNTGR